MDAKKWLSPKSWGSPKSKSLGVIRPIETYGDLGIPHFRDPKSYHPKFRGPRSAHQIYQPGYIAPDDGTEDVFIHFQAVINGGAPGKLTDGVHTVKLGKTRKLGSFWPFPNFLWPSMVNPPSSWAKTWPFPDFLHHLMTLMGRPIPCHSPTEPMPR